MAWYDYAQAAGKSLSDIGTGIHEYRQERREEKREDVLDKRALEQEHRNVQTFLNQQRDRRHRLGKEFYDAADLDQIFQVSDDNTKMMIDAVGKNMFESVPGVPGAIRVIDTPERQFARRTTSQELSNLEYLEALTTEQKNALKLWQSPTFATLPQAQRERIMMILGHDVERGRTFEERRAEAMISASVLAAQLREATYERIQKASLDATEKGRLLESFLEIQGQFVDELEAMYPNGYAPEQAENLWDNIRNRYSGLPISEYLTESIGMQDSPILDRLQGRGSFNVTEP